MSTPKKSPKNPFERRGRAPKGPKSCPNWTPEVAKLMAEKSTNARKLRAAVRARLLDIAVNGGKLESIFLNGLNGDMESMAIAEKAAKMVGLDFASSPESVQKVEMDGKMEHRSITINFRKATPEDAK